MEGIFFVVAVEDIISKVGVVTSPARILFSQCLSNAHETAKITFTIKEKSYFHCVDKVAIRFYSYIR